MHKKLSFTHDENTRIFFTSDPHLNHDKDFIYKKRGYSNREEYNKAWLEHVNATVKPNDCLFIIGDFSLNSTVEQVEVWLQQINCKVYLIWGNHESSTYRIYKNNIEKIYQKDIEVYPFFWKNIVFLGDYQEIDVVYNVEGVQYRQSLILCHYPIAVWNNVARNTWHLCGHSHYSFEPSTIDGTSMGKMLDVGFDGMHQIYAFDEITSILTKKDIKALDHHE